jgi:hypothetical protein
MIIDHNDQVPNKVEDFLLLQGSVGELMTATTVLAD